MYDNGATRITISSAEPEFFKDTQFFIDEVSTLRGTSTARRGYDTSAHLHTLKTRLQGNGARAHAHWCDNMCQIHICIVEGHRLRPPDARPCWLERVCLFVLSITSVCPPHAAARLWKGWSSSVLSAAVGSALTGARFGGLDLRADRRNMALSFSITCAVCLSVLRLPAAHRYCTQQH
jgi:hypothetical protein